MIITSSVTPSTPAPARTWIAVRAASAQPSANGVTRSTSTGSWMINKISSAAKTTDMISGGTAPSQNSRGR